jgi:hypothetical protein
MNGIERELLAHLDSEAQVADMDRVKSSTENADGRHLTVHTRTRLLMNYTRICPSPMTMNF